MSTYTMYAQPVPVSERLDSWQGHLGPFTHIFGHSGLGHLFLVDMSSGDCALFYPLEQALKNYGSFASPADFEERILQDPYVEQVILLRDGQSQLAEQLGPLTDEECYYPVPYPFLGGSGDLDTYDKGNIWVFEELVAQLAGIDPKG